MQSSRSGGLAWRLVQLKVDKAGAAFSYRLNLSTLKQVRRREGRYLLRTSLTETDPVKLWNYYLQLVQVEEAFRTSKSDLAILMPAPPRLPAAAAH